MQVITYSLCNGENNSNNFYQQLSVFTDLVLQKWYTVNPALLFNYKEYINHNNKEPQRSDEEYIFDFINFCVLLNLYGNRAQQLLPVAGRLLVQLYTLRRRYKSLKPVFDKLRGFLATLILDRKTRRSIGNFDLDKVVLFLGATGEYREEVKRFCLIVDFLNSLTACQMQKYITGLTEFAEWFTTKSEASFACYTSNVAAFIQEKLAAHKWQEDYFFCGRKQVEYHVSMVGAELMNRAFYNQFAQTEQRALLLPACMRAKQGSACQAKKISLDYQCSGCTRDCRIHQYTILGRELGFAVHIIPHSSDFTSWLRTFAMNKNIGVIGVACPLNLITGGLELKSLDIPAQCILLDYCGCTNHWHKTGIATDINRRQLLKMINPVYANVDQVVACA